MYLKWKKGAVKELKKILTAFLLSKHKHI